MGLVALRHVGSSRIRARTRVPCIGRWVLNHCATREAHVHRYSDLHLMIHKLDVFKSLFFIFLSSLFFPSECMTLSNHGNQKFGKKKKKVIALTSTGQQRVGRRRLREDFDPLSRGLTSGM